MTIKLSLSQEPLDTVVLDPTTWLRGEGADVSFLRRPSDEKMCCMGVALAHCGFEPAALEGEATLDTYAPQEMGERLAELNSYGRSNEAWGSSISDSIANFLTEVGEREALRELADRVYTIPRVYVQHSSVIDAVYRINDSQSIDDETRLRLLNTIVKYFGFQFVLKG